MNELDIDGPAKWKTRILRQIQTADPVGIWAESRARTLYVLQYNSEVVGTYDPLSAHTYTGSAVPLNLAQYRYVPFCVLITYLSRKLCPMLLYIVGKLSL